MTLSFYPKSKLIRKLLPFANNIITTQKITKTLIHLNFKTLKKIFLLLLFISPSLFGQDMSNETKPLLSPSQLQKDFDIAIESINSVHPSVNRYISAKEFDGFINEMKQELENPATEDDLHIVLRKIIKQIACGHTVARPSSKWYGDLKNPSLLPFSVYIINDKLYIKALFDQDSLVGKGMELLAIDGKSSEEILEEMNAIQEKDGYIKGFARKKIERLFSTYYLFLYGQNDFYDISFMPKDGSIQKIQLKGGKLTSTTNTETNSPEFLFEINTSDAKFYIEKENPTLGILDINSFQQKGYKKFYKEVFREIESRNIDNLVLDLRNNGGGYFPNGNILLSYLMDSTIVMHFERPNKKVLSSPHLKMNFGSKMTRTMFNLMPDKDKEDENRNYTISYKTAKKNAYKGNLFVLINGASFSMSSYVSSKLNQKNRVVFIGEECGGTENGSNAILEYQLTLPESGIRILIPYYFLDHNNKPDKEGRGIQPDYEIDYSLEDVMKGKDLEMEKVLQLFERK